MTWQWSRISRPRRSGYTLTELLVVIAITVFLATLSVPNLFGGDDRYILNNEANQIKQMLNEAKVRSLAPSKNDGNGAQIYQVAFGSFPTNATAENQLVAKGTGTTNTVTLQRGIASCATKAVQGSLTPIETRRLSRGIYVSSFYPTNLKSGETTSVVRFSVGEVGFTCGKDSQPAISSADFADPNWKGKAGAANTQARYLVIELASSRVKQTAYVVVDRLNSEIEVVRSHPQSYFTPVYDAWSPRWKTPFNFDLSVSCSTVQSQISLSFTRAEDRFGDNGTPNDPNDDPVDPSRLVFYDLYWKQDGTGSNDKYQALASKYFYDLSQDKVIYTFQTNSLTVAKQPEKITFRLWAFDENSNYSETAPAGGGLPEEGYLPSGKFLGYWLGQAAASTTKLAKAIGTDFDYTDETFQDVIFSKGDDWNCSGVQVEQPRGGSTSDPNYGARDDDYTDSQENPGTSDISSPVNDGSTYPGQSPESPPQ